MDFYTRKTKAFREIDGYIQKGKYDREAIMLTIIRNYGVTEKFVNDYVDKLKKAGVVSEDKFGILRIIKQND